MKRYFREVVPLGIAIFAILVLFRGCAHAQDHAPTLEQCRADINLWDSEAQRNGDVDVTMHDLNQRAIEIGRCLSSYPSEPDHHAWVNAHIALHSVMEDRYSAFIARHNLFGQFIDEDKAGKR